MENQWSIKYCRFTNGNIVTIAESTLKILNSSGSEVLNTKLSYNFNCITTSLDNYIYLAGGNKIAKYDENGKKFGKVQYQKVVVQQDIYLLLLHIQMEVLQQELIDQQPIQ